MNNRRYQGVEKTKEKVMRKVHYKVVLDVLVHEDEEADGNEALMCADFFPNVDGDDLDVMDVEIESVEATDSR